MKIRVFRPTAFVWSMGISPIIDWLVNVRCTIIRLDLQLIYLEVGLDWRKL